MEFGWHLRLVIQCSFGHAGVCVSADASTRIKLMKEIILGNGQVAIADDVDHEQLSRHKWQYSNGYAFRRRLKSEGETGYVKMHRLIAGAREGECVDHINLNRLDNRRSNLRICTVAQNLYNKAATKVSKLGVKGVFLCSEKRMTLQGYKRPYRAKMKVGGVVYLDRTYYTIEEAKAAYDACALKYQGEFSRS